MNKFDYKNIPDELKAVRAWVCWQGTKLPKNPLTGGNAMSNNPNTWGTFEQALEAIDRYGFDGLGFMFAPPYFGVDLDHCAEDVAFIDEFVNTLGSYAEYSKSGTGIHIICKGTLPDGGRRKGNVEMYSCGRFFITTGNLYKKEYTQVVDCSETIKYLHKKYIDNSPVKEAIAKEYVELQLSDNEILDKAMSARNSETFTMLYNGEWEQLYSSQSDADLALCSKLAFWTQRNPEQIDRIFRSSRLMRDKWDEMRGSMRYGEMTINKAISTCANVYSGSTAKAFDEPRYTPSSSKQECDFFDLFEYDQSDTGNGKRLVRMFGGKIKYSQNRKSWYIWNGKNWQRDETLEIRRLADKVCVQMKKEAFRIVDEEKQQEALKFAARTQSTHAKDNMINEAKHTTTVAIPADYFDQQIDLINFENGIIDLQTGKMLEHDPVFALSKICSTSVKDDGKPERWLQFLDEVTNGDKDLQRFLQKLVGYSLTASTKEQCFFVLYGSGCNGKSTFTDIISELMGSYAANAQVDTIMQRKGSQTANTDIARLAGARLVTIAEPEDGARLNESLIKQLAGSDKVTARFLFGDEFEYKPQFKIWISTNHKPIIRGTDDGIWRRVVLIPFTVKIPQDRIDKDLPAKLRKELPQIANWAVEGCLAWREEGLLRPKCVSDATQAYRQESDVLSKFCEDCIVSCDDDEEAKVKANELYNIYKRWCTDNNEYEHTATRFGREFTNKYPHKIRGNDGVYYRYCKISEFAAKNYIEQPLPLLKFNTSKHEGEPSHDFS